MGAEHVITDPDEYIREAALHSDYSVAWAESIRVAPEIWNAILDKDPDQADTAVDYPDLPVTIVNRLARSIWSWIRFQIAYHPKLPDETLDLLKLDVYSGVRRAIANSGRATLDDLIEILDGGDSLPNLDAASRIQEMYGIHWRDCYQEHIRPRFHPFTDPEIARSLLASEQIAESEILSLSTYTDERLHPSSSIDFALWMAGSGHVTREFAGQLVGSDGAMGRTVAAMALAADPSINAALAFDDCGSVREAVVRSPKTDLATQIYLSFDDTAWVRYQARRVLACSYGLVPPMIVAWRFGESLLCDPIPNMVEWDRLRRSADTSDRVRAKYGSASAQAVSEALDSESPLRFLLASSIEADVAVAVLAAEFDSENERWRSGLESLQFSARPDILERLIQDPHWYLRRLAANCTNLSPQLRRILAKDKDQRVREQARWTWHWLADREGPDDSLSGSPYRFHAYQELADVYATSEPNRRHFSSEKPAPAKWWHRFIKERPDLAKWVAINQTVGPKLLDELADWPDPEVRGWVADHRRIWIKTLIRLANDPDPDVRRYATYNAKMPDTQLRKLALDSEPATREEALRRLEVRAFADKLLKDPEWWRYLGNSPF